VHNQFELDADLLDQSLRHRHNQGGASVLAQSVQHRQEVMASGRTRVNIRSTLTQRKRLSAYSSMRTNAAGFVCVWKTRDISLSRFLRTLLFVE
jgi:hypothetical protein